jgi:hypothetical protein
MVLIKALHMAFLVFGLSPSHPLAHLSILVNALFPLEDLSPFDLACLQAPSSSPMKFNAAHP